MVHVVTNLHFAAVAPRARSRASVACAVREGANDARTLAPAAAPRPAPGAEPEASASEVASWIAAIAAHADRAAFARLFRLYAPKVKGQLMARGAAVGVADELTQDVMLTVWRKAAQFDATKGTAAGWLYAITRNRLLNHVRDAGYPQPERELEEPTVADAAPGPEEELAWMRQREDLARALEALPSEQAAVLRGAYWRGQTLQECADEQRLPLGTVKTRVRLALARLRAILGGEP
jgi:RNA polymerase sigma-70 factor (ECF subfamily)